MELFRQVAVFAAVLSARGQLLAQSSHQDARFLVIEMQRIDDQAALMQQTMPDMNRRTSAA